MALVLPPRMVRRPNGGHRPISGPIVFHPTQGPPSPGGHPPIFHPPGQNPMDYMGGRMGMQTGHPLNGGPPLPSPGGHPPIFRQPGGVLPPRTVNNPNMPVYTGQGRFGYGQGNHGMGGQSPYEQLLAMIRRLAPMPGGPRGGPGTRRGINYNGPIRALPGRQTPGTVPPRRPLGF